MEKRLFDLILLIPGFSLAPALNEVANCKQRFISGENNNLIPINERHSQNSSKKKTPAAHLIPPILSRALNLFIDRLQSLLYYF